MKDCNLKLQVETKLHFVRVVHHCNRNQTTIVRYNETFSWGNKQEPQIHQAQGITHRLGANTKRHMASPRDNSANSQKQTSRAMPGSSKKNSRHSCGDISPNTTSFYFSTKLEHFLEGGGAEYIRQEKRKLSSTGRTGSVEGAGVGVLGACEYLNKQGSSNRKTGAKLPYHIGCCAGLG